MSGSLMIAMNKDGSATATVTTESSGFLERTFPNMESAAIWAEEMLYGKGGEENGNISECSCDLLDGCKDSR